MDVDSEQNVANSSDYSKTSVINSYITRTLKSITKHAAWQAALTETSDDEMDTLNHEDSSCHSNVIAQARDSVS